MSDLGAEGVALGAEVVDMCAVTAAELAPFWESEERWWRDRLLWDVSDAFASLRRMLGRGILPGKAVQVQGQTVGYAISGMAGHLGVILGFAVLPIWSNTCLGEMLLGETVNDLRRKGVTRVESQFLSDECHWLPPVFERQGFQTHWREFLRLTLPPTLQLAPASTMVSLEPWRESALDDAAGILQAAYEEGPEAELYECYRSRDGCHRVLENILWQDSCGSLVYEASAVARHRGRAVGFVIITQIAPHHGHLPQVAVLPEYQGYGIGQSLLRHSLARLGDGQFSTVSLIVDRANHRASRIYHRMGWQKVMSYPVFTWEGSRANSR